MKKRKKAFSFLDVSIIVVVVSFVMYFLGAVLVYKHLGGVNFSALGENQNLKEFISAYNELLENYYDSLDEKKLISGAIAGMYEITGDPYTTYLDETSSEVLDDSLNGTYNGIGVLISLNEDNRMEIQKVYADTPASKAGLKVGDIILKVDGSWVDNLNYEDILEHIKNSKKSLLTISSSGVEKEVTIEPTTLSNPVITSKILEKDGKRIGYMGLSIFSNTADIQFSNELSELENSGIDALIIDLRGNTGGYLQVAHNIAEMFLEKGKIIYSLESKSKKKDYKDNTSENRKYKVALLINNASASASEILAASLKYSGNGILIGKTSYGKGKVQEKANLTSGTTLKYTTAKWLTPKGDCIDGKGLNPDIEVDLDTNTFQQNDIYTDTQVIKALESLVD